ncbi:3-dehydroquinate synthase [Streptomyces sp. NBC_01433]|uniref:3-dehydroquinate synthase family protein n=1 Tax=Streptomyces sp. NBC_01433 TaxID=2903864 RepID=UPI00225242F5|nr:3-dehydroquinate synthase family protein [Streptomyces sp. NBC_01433]MCX4682185.1 3-dehydroquinate synthase [Streptomyces sp. NBC_01433]
MTSSHLGVSFVDQGPILVRAHRIDNYAVHVDDGLLTRPSSLLTDVLDRLDSPDVVIAVDTGAAEHHLGAVTAAVLSTGRPFQVVPVPAGEASKSPRGLRDLIGALHRHRASRRTLLLAVGGGMVCDLATTTAAGYMRGIPYALLPTTVLAQVDAAIGGKGGLDDNGAKNLLGAFHHPAAVFVDPLLTGTLPERHVRNGLAEVIKVALIDDADLVNVLEQHPDQLPTGQALTGIVRAAIAAKLRLLATDPFEQGDLRRLLNFGHCVGHPYEAATGYQVLHGEAVAVGMAVAAAHAHLTGVATLAERDRILGLLDAYRLPAALPEAMRELTWEGMDTVRRVRGGPLHLVLPRTPGNCTVTDDIDRTSYDKAISELAARP